MGLAPYGEKHSDQDENLPSFKSLKLNYFCDYSKILNRHPSPSLKIKIEEPKIKATFITPITPDLPTTCKVNVKKQ